MLIDLIELKEKPKQILEARVAANLFRSILTFENEFDQDKEHFWAIGLNSKNIILYVDLVALGTLNNTLIHPREVFRMAILKAAANIIVGHNHPSGSLEVSREDEEITLHLEQSGKILGIELLDHIIIGNNNPGYFSLKWDKKENKEVHPKNVGHFDFTPKFKSKEMEIAIKSNKKAQNALKEMKEAMSQLLTF